MVTSDLGRVTTALDESSIAAAEIVVTSDLGRVTTFFKCFRCLSFGIVVTSDLGRVTTAECKFLKIKLDCGDVRSRTSYNSQQFDEKMAELIVVTSDLGRVTTLANDFFVFYSSLW